MGSLYDDKPLRSFESPLFLSKIWTPGFILYSVVSIYSGVYLQWHPPRAQTIFKILILCKICTPGSILYSVRDLFTMTPASGHFGGFTFFKQNMNPRVHILQYLFTIISTQIPWPCSEPEWKTEAGIVEHSPSNLDTAATSTFHYQELPLT